MKKNLLDLNLQFFAEEGASENTSEVAEPIEAEQPMDETDAGEGAEDTNETADESANVQSAEENAKYAAARRRAEAEFNQRQQAMDAEFARRFEGYENPITHKPIRNQREYFEALDAQEKLKRDEELQSKGIDPQLFEDMVNRQVNNNPTVLQAQQVIQRANQEHFANETAKSVREISALNPNIKTLDDVFALPNFNELLTLVERNNISLADAYKLKNFDSLMAGKVASAKQAALNNMNGTSHLSQTGGVAEKSNEVEIPAGELAQWKRAFPNATHAELRKKYNSTL